MRANKRKSWKKSRIGVLLGGTSAEREVSLRSGRAVHRALKTLGCSAVMIDAGSDLCAALDRARIDCAFIALHGGHGENGAVQGLLEIKGIPYTGSGVLASAIAMDKEASKKVFQYHGVPVPRFLVVSKQRRSHAAPTFDMPWVVKPATEGSSVGVRIVKTQRQYAAALKAAFGYGDRVLVEEYIKGKEVQIAILNGRPIGGVEVRPSLEFYSYEAKYTAGLTQYIMPPEVDRRTYEWCSSAALAAHHALGCSGATRVDLIVDASRRVHVLEVNTIPGMTETSLLPKIAAHAGLSFPDLIAEIMEGIGG
ncbi:MAG: D-alanine--D-alanine ligase [Thermodesulfovibrionales bacterium]